MRKLTSIGVVPTEDGGHDEYTKVETIDAKPLDLRSLAEDEHQDRRYYRCAGQLFCDRVTVIPHPHRDNEAVLVVHHQLDI